MRVRGRLAAESLQPLLDWIAQGASAFWGYAENFLFLRKAIPPAELTTDQTAQDTLRMDCPIDEQILNGRAAATVYEIVTRYVAELCKELRSYRRTVLLSNYRHLVCPVIMN